MGSKVFINVETPNLELFVPHSPTHMIDVTSKKSKKLHYLREVLYFEIPRTITPLVSIRLQIFFFDLILIICVSRLFST